MHFFERLEQRARSHDTLLCVGLDPHPKDVPEQTPRAVRDFCLRLVRATSGVACAYKPNSAFFEALGPDGLAVLHEVVAAVPDGIPVLLDAKRGDIASTAEAYARAAWATGAGAVTLSPYLGWDSVEPFLREPERGVFLLCRTSNEGAAFVQDALVFGRPLYERVAGMAQRGSGRVGLVVGATQPEALARVRAVAPDAWILAPGVGAQGGDLDTALDAGLRADGLGLLLPVSRGITRASDPSAEAERLRAQIQAGRVRAALALADRSTGSVAQPAFPAALATGLVDAGCVRFGTFTLKSGLTSPIYIDLRRLAGFPALLTLVADAYCTLLRDLSFDVLAALPYAALPIGTAVSLFGGWPLVYPRREAKEYGTRAVVEGVFEAGQTAVVVDDLATTGGSKLEAVERLVEAGLAVRDMAVLIDRESGARETLAKEGHRLHAIFTLSALLDFWERTGKVPAAQIEAARAFVRATRP